ncbi:MAG: porin family protein [Holophagaceae bacterium]|nr:porin family protein [Holophagaceae bacterium]
MTTLSRFALGLVLVTGAGLSAQDVRFGVQASGNAPLGDLKDAVDSKPGLGAGAHLTWNLGGGHVIRPRFDYLFFPENGAYAADGYGVSANGKYKVSDLSVGVDYLYFLEGKDEGLYLTAGLGLHRWTVDYDYTVRIGNVTSSGSESDSTNKAGFAVGAGYNFNRSFGAEVRFTTTKFGKNEGSANALQAGVTFRF